MDYIKIILNSDLCAGSGESAGNSVDSDICTNAQGLPYIPARRIKGCLRQAAEEIVSYAGNEADKYKGYIRQLFGDAFGNEGILHIYDAVIDGSEQLSEWIDNKALTSEVEAVRNMAHSRSVTGLFTSVRGKTALKDGVKIDNSLRFVRVLNQYNPLYSDLKKMEFTSPAYIDSEDEELYRFTDMCCKAMRHMGLSRNRGLGNVAVSYKKDNHGQNSNSDKVIVPKCPDSEMVHIEYQVSIDAPLTLPGCEDMETLIPARSVIGAMASQYMKNYSDEKIFEQLFLDGTVRWSALTPVVGGNRSYPMPLIYARLKNGKNRIVNQYIEPGTAWKSMKPKTMEGAYITVSGTEAKYVSPDSHIVYHNSRQKTELYMQVSLDAGMIYGGCIDVPAALYDKVTALMADAKLKFGRSRNSQYAACSLKDIKAYNWESRKLHVTAGQKIYVVLKSDLCITEDGEYVQNEGAVLDRLTKAFGMSRAEEDISRCLYGMVGGYQAMWQLQKPHVPVIKAGSVYVLKSDRDAEIDKKQYIGEFLQEGFGECEAYTEEEMKLVCSIEKGDIDRKQVAFDDTLISNFKDALLIKAARETLYRYARVLSNEFVRSDNVHSGRLRRMISEAVSYEDFINKVNTMKDSDKDSSRDGKKETSIKIIAKIYGSIDKIDWRKLLEAENGLYDEINKSPEAKAGLKKLWKLPMMQLLHVYHYAKED